MLTLRVVVVLKFLILAVNLCFFVDLMILELRLVLWLDNVMSEVV